jgi:hypothetical protein
MVLNNSFPRTDGDGFHELEDLRARFLREHAARRRLIASAGQMPEHHLSQ